MQTQTCETHIEQDAELSILEGLYKNLDQQLGRPARDTEICKAMKITLEEFHQILDRMKGLGIGSFRRIGCEAKHDSQIKYIPDALETNSLEFQESEIREKLANAIEELPMMERLITSLYFFDELSLKEIEAILGINENCISQLQTKAMLRLRSRLNG
jgi:RNA polymerase sigma factor FliA